MSAFEGVPRRALRRYVLPPLLAGVLVAVALWFLVAWWPLLVVVPCAAWGVIGWRDAGWAVEGERLAVRFRMLSRVTVLAPIARLQQHGVRQTVWQRRAELADVAVAVGAGTRGRVRHLDARVAGRLFDALRRSARDRPSPT